MLMIGTVGVSSEKENGRSMLDNFAERWLFA